MAAGTLFVVATPIGNLEDITVRALRVLREASLIAAEDTRRTSHLLARYAIATPTTSLHEHNEGAKSASLVARLQQGENIALVSDAGTPTVSDPGAELIRQAIDAGIRVEPIPGASAVLALLAASGFPADAFSFHGFPPTRSVDRKRWLSRLRQTPGTAVFFEAPHRIQITLAELQRVIGDVEAVVGRELTKAHEELVRGHISDVALRFATGRGEFVVGIRVGETPESDLRAEPQAAELVAEVGQLTASGGFTKRRAIGSIARKHGLAPNRVYEMLEAAKKSGG